MKKSDFAVIGLGVMGASLARNVESRGYTVSVYNRDHKKTDKFLKSFEGNFQTGNDYKSFIKTIARPRKILIMVKAGAPVDYVIADLLPHLNKGDIIIDGGNSYYKDTQRREADLKKKGMHFVGMGVSGGEEGALTGPSMMPGGSKESWKILKPILTNIAAKDFAGGPCVTHIGADGAGHYVKMVHNGIEYGVMQLLAEAYDIYRNVYKLKPNQISNIFAKYNKGKLNSFLFEISTDILAKKDDIKGKRGYLIDKILDKAAQKGTGKWTSADTLDRGLPLPTITEAVYARYISGEKSKREQLAKLYKKKKTGKPMPLATFEKLLEDALYAAMFSTYAQGYALIARTAKQEKWNINFSEVSRIWQGGCIIRAKLLKILHTASVTQTFRSDKNPHLFQVPAIQKIMISKVSKLRQIVSVGSTTGLPLASLATALYYFDAMTTANLPANFIQGLRDNFGAHTYERIDKRGSFHTQWNE